ncbi:MAG: hypothetical protein P8Y12_12445 [Gammaproteobacteria bacterium]
MCPMNYAIQQLRRMRAWHVVVVVALAGAADGRADCPPASVNVSNDY